MLHALLAAACLTTAAGVPETELAVGFTDVIHLGPAALISSADGTVRSLEDAELQVALNTGRRMYGLTVSADLQHVAAVGAGIVARSDDGGRIFRIERIPDGDSAWTATFVGKALLIFDSGGHIYRSERSTHFEQVNPPLLSRWRASAFEGKRGYVVGEHGALIATTDGGRSWKVLQSPDPEPQGVLLDADRLFISGQRGVFRSDDEGETFKRIFAVPLETSSRCGRMSHRGSLFAVACAPIGHALFVSEGGDHFDEVKVPEAGNLLSVSISPSGDLVAVGASETVVRATTRAGSLLLHSEPARKWLKEYRRYEEAKSLTHARLGVPDRDARVIKGIVRDELGRPFSGATLTLSPCALKTESRADGSFTFPPCAASMAALTVTAASFAPLRRDQDVDPSAATFLDLQLERAVQLNGTVIGAKGGIARLLPVPPPAADRVRWVSARAPLRESTLAANGRFAFDGIASGEYLLDVRPIDAPAFSTFVRAPDNSLEVAPQQGGRITGRFLTPSGRPVSGGEVKTGGSLVKVDRLGQFVFTGISEGEYLLQAIDPVTRVCLRRRVGVREGLPTDVTFQLGKLPSIRGRVVDRQGQPIAGARVMANSSEDPLCGARSTETDARGEFTLFDVSDASYEVSVLTPGSTLKSGESLPRAQAKPNDKIEIVVRR